MATQNARRMGPYWIGRAVWLSGLGGWQQAVVRSNDGVTVTVQALAGRPEASLIYVHASAVARDLRVNRPAAARGTYPR